MVEDMKGIKMEMCIWEILKMGKHMVKGNILGVSQVRYMMESGLKGRDMVMGYGKMLKEIVILENGGMGKQ
jgi:hypothetical protein